jgi:hypothetical protein
VTIETWRQSLSENLADHLAEPLMWDEGPDAPYFTDKPTWDCYSDLLLWAASEELPQLLCPAHHCDDWSSDPAYLLCVANGSAGRYQQLYDVAIWLPCGFGFVFKYQDTTGQDVR